MSGAAASAAGAAAAAGSACVGAGAATAKAGDGGATTAASRETLILRSPSSTSISVRPVSDSSSASSRTILVSTFMLALRPFLSFSAMHSSWLVEQGRRYAFGLAAWQAAVAAENRLQTRGRFQCQLIAERTEPRDGALGRHRDEALVPIGLARVRVRDVHLDHRRLDRADRVVDRQAGMRQSARVQQHRLRTLGLSLVQPVAQVPLVIRLPDIDLEPQLAPFVLEPRGNVVERVRTVNLRLAQAEQVQVRPVDDIDFVGHRLPLGWPVA